MDEKCVRDPRHNCFGLEAAARLEAAELAQDAQDAIENLGVVGETISPGEQVQVIKTVGEDGVVTLTFRIPQGIQGIQGPQGESVASIQRTSGTGAAGTTDTYTMYSTDGTTIGTFNVYNGMDGLGSGDMLKSVYDTQNKNTDIFQYVDQKIAALKQEILGMNFFVVQEGENV